MEILQRILNTWRFHYYFIHKSVKKGKIEVVKVDSENNIAHSYKSIRKC